MLQSGIFTVYTWLIFDFRIASKAVTRSCKNTWIFPTTIPPAKKNNYSKFGNFTLCPSLLHFKGDRAKGNNSTSKHKETAWGWLRCKPSRFKSKPTSLGRHRKRRSLWTITPGLSKTLQSAPEGNCFQRNRIQVWTISQPMKVLELNEMISYVFFQIFSYHLDIIWLFWQKTNARLNSSVASPQTELDTVPSGACRVNTVSTDHGEEKIMVWQCGTTKWFANRMQNTYEIILL